jgi:hypothetical protein
MGINAPSVSGLKAYRANRNLHTPFSVAVYSRLIDLPFK